jgi:hypothetical protein
MIERLGWADVKMKESPRDSTNVTRISGASMHGQSGVSD